jgi:diacylglycerol kinase family enzyme
MSEHYDATFTLGGDGTADEVIGVLAGRGIPVGILPGGTGNLLARTLGTPLTVHRAVAALLDGQIYRCDLGLINGSRHFAFTVGVGADARMMAETSTGAKRMFGVLSYATTAAKVSLFRQPLDVCVTVDGERIERRATFAMVANFGSVLNDLLQLGPNVSSDDGRLDVCIFSPDTLQDASRIIFKMASKDFSADPCMDFRSGTKVRIECDPATVVQADGDLIGNTPVDIEVKPLAATLLRVRTS